MNDPRRSGRIVGALILAQLPGGLLLYFVLSAPLFDEPGFLVNAAPHARQMGLSALLGLALTGMFLAMAITAFPIFRRHSPSMAILFVAMAVVSLSATSVEQAHVMSMVSLSEAYTKAIAAERERFEALRVVVASSRNWAHFLGRLTDGTTVLVLYAALYRSALVPRALAALGLAAALCQMTAVLMPLLGHGVIFPMLMPLAVMQLVLALWLVARGFRSVTEPGAA